MGWRAEAVAARVAGDERSGGRRGDEDKGAGPVKVILGQGDVFGSQGNRRQSGRSGGQTPIGHGQGGIQRFAAGLVRWVSGQALQHVTLGQQAGGGLVDAGPEDVYLAGQAERLDCGGAGCREGRVAPQSTSISGCSRSRASAVTPGNALPDAPPDPATCSAAISTPGTRRIRFTKPTRRSAQPASSLQVSRPACARPPSRPTISVSAASPAALPSSRSPAAITASAASGSPTQVFRQITATPAALAFLSAAIEPPAEAGVTISRAACREMRRFDQASFAYGITTGAVQRQRQPGMGRRVAKARLHQR